MYVKFTYYRQLNTEQLRKEKITINKERVGTIYSSFHGGFYIFSMEFIKIIDT